MENENNEKEIQELKDKIVELEKTVKALEFNYINDRSKKHVKYSDKIFNIVKNIKIRSIICMIFTILIVTLPWFVSFIRSSITNVAQITGWNINYLEISGILEKIKVFVTIVLSIIIFSLCILNAVKILSTDFENEKINSNKTLWGVLTIILLGWIASWIFAWKAKKEMTN